MAGIAAIIGSSDRKSVQEMSDRISHRGNQASGFASTSNGVVFQTCLAADMRYLGRDATVPVRWSDASKAVICYDGNLYVEFRHEAPDGSHSDEHLLLELYAEKGVSMVHELPEGVFAFLIVDGSRFLAARDLLGIKTLFYGYRDDAVLFASELKALVGHVERVCEFPPGHYMDESGRLVRFAALPRRPVGHTESPPERIAEQIRSIVHRRTEAALDNTTGFASLLSGGLDSSVIAAEVRSVVGARTPPESLSTFSVGTGESSDVRHARTMAKHLGSDHHEYELTVEEMASLLPDVIYYLESFDPSLVRSAVANYVATREAKRHGVEVVFSGEGGDELFCGYAHFAGMPESELFANRIDTFEQLHNIASLRLDRMNLCHSVRVETPFVSDELLRLALSIPPQYLLADDGAGGITEKWILRAAYEDALPESIATRTKQEFSQGSGSASTLTAHFEREVSDGDFADGKKAFPFLRNKEEFHYLELFRRHYDDESAVATVGRWTST